MKSPFLLPPGCEFHTHAGMPPGIRAQIEQLAFTHGVYYDSYLAVEPDREYFWSPHRRGAIGVVRRGRQVMATGGLLAPPEAQEELLECAAQFARLNRLHLSFYNIGAAQLPLFEARDFQITKWGEEGLIDLEGLTWQGGQFEWLRRQSNFCRRKGLVVEEVSPRTHSPEALRTVYAEARALSAAQLATTPQGREMQVMEGQFLPERMPRSRVFIARAGKGAGRMEGFIYCIPGRAGAMWTVEIYRRKLDGVRGVVPFLIQEAARIFQAEGVAILSIGMLPGFRIDQPRIGDSALARRGLSFALKYLPFLFNLRGIQQLKTSFRPRFEDRFVCVWPRITVLSTWRFLHMWGVIRLHPIKTAASLWEHLRKVRNLPATDAGKGLGLLLSMGAIHVSTGRDFTHFETW